MALACDIVLAARSARFIQAFCKIGLVPDSGGTYFLPRLVGDARARALALMGEPVSAEQAEAWGLIWKAADDDRLQDEAVALARRFAAGPTGGLGLIRRALNASPANDLSTASSTSSARRAAPPTTGGRLGLRRGGRRRSAAVEA